MRTIAIANQKGGVAKTTSAHNLGAALAGLGMRVLAVDLDSQASLTISMGLEPLEMVKTMADVMKRDALPIRECIVHVRDGLDAAPSVIDLAAAEMELLSMTGVEVDTAENGKEALEAFAAAPLGRYLAILMDIRMPVMDGLEAAKAIRALPKQDAGSVPIIAMTANAFDDDRTLAYRAGMTGYIVKPLDIDTLLDELRKL